MKRYGWRECQPFTFQTPFCLLLHAGLCHAADSTDNTLKLLLQAVLQCTVQDKSGALQWTRDGFGLGHDRALPGYPRMRMVGPDPARDWHLSIDPVELGDEGEYQCQVLSTDPAQTIRSTTARLEVRAPCSAPSIEPDGELALEEGTTTSLSCSCAGARPPARLEWRWGQEVVGLGNSTVSKEPGTLLTYRTVSVLQLKARQDQDGRVMSCGVVGVAASQAEVTLTVTFPPRVVVEGAGPGARLMMGSQAELECRAEARPGVEQWGWSLAGREVENGSSHLVVENLYQELQGAKVECWAENSLGRGEAEVELFIYGE